MAGGQAGGGGEVGGSGGGEVGGEGGGRDQHAVATITTDLLGGAQGHESSGQTNNCSSILKSLLRNNAKRLTENVVTMLVKKEKERSLVLKEKDDQICNFKNMMNILKGELSKAEDSTKLLKMGLQDEKSSKLSFSKLCDGLTLEVDCLKKDLEKVTENANFVMNEVVKEKENEIKLKGEAIFNLTKQLKLKEEAANSAAKEHSKQIEVMKKEQGTSAKDSTLELEFEIGISNAVKGQKEREIREARKEILDAKSALDLKQKEIEVLRYEKSCSAHDFSEMSNQQLKTKSALDFKEKEIEVLKVERRKDLEVLRNAKEKEIKVLQNEMTCNAHDFSIMSKRQLKISSALEKEIELLKFEKEKNLEALMGEKENEIEVLQSEKARNAQEFSSMSNKVLIALKKERKQNKQLLIWKLKQQEQIDLLTKQKELIQEKETELKTSNEKQKDEIDKLVRQKASIQGLMVELETTKEKQIAELEKVAAREVFVEKLIGLVFKLKSKLRRQAHKSKCLKTQLMSTVSHFQKTKKEHKIQHDKLGEIVSKNRSLQEMNHGLLSTASSQGTHRESCKEKLADAPTASGSKMEGKGLTMEKEESSLEMFELESAAEEHNLKTTYNVLDPTDGYILVEVVLRGETDGDCKRLVGRGKGEQEAKNGAAKMALDFLTRFDQGKDDFDELLVESEKRMRECVPAEIIDARRCQKLDS